MEPILKTGAADTTHFSAYIALLRWSGYLVAFCAATLTAIYYVSKYDLYARTDDIVVLGQFIIGPLLALTFGIFRYVRSPIAGLLLFLSWIVPILFSQIIPCYLWYACG